MIVGITVNSDSVRSVIRPVGQSIRPAAALVRAPGRWWSPRASACQLRATAPFSSVTIDGWGSAMVQPGGRAVRLVLMYSIALTLASVAPRGQTTATPAVADLVLGLTRETAWNLVETVPMKFTTYHPQGMVKIGDTLFVSSVEVKVRTQRFAQPVDGYDRDVGEGVGHLFKVGHEGKPPRRSDARRGSHLPSRRNRLRRPLHLGARHRVPARTADRSSIGSIRSP